MRILWYSSTPECNSGYGVATRNMVKWLQRQGHFVAVATKHAMTIPMRKWENDIAILDGTNLDVLNTGVIDPWKIDACITFFDIWVWDKQEPKLEKHIGSWIPIDTENINKKILKVARDIPVKIAMTRHGEAELRNAGFDPLYAPIGFDPAVFYPKPDEGCEFRESLVFKDPIGPDDMFLIGSVGINYPGDRKGYISLMRAFKKFHEKRKNARLFLHTTANKKKDGLNYAALAMDIGIGDWVAWPHQERLWYALYDQEVLSEIYSGFDVFCLPTKGEGFGMPALEAQACGVPVVITDNTSGDQLCKTGTLIDTDWDDLEYLGSNVWRKSPKPSAVLCSLNTMYAAWEVGAYRNDKDIISERVSEYQWPNIWETYWIPILERIEEVITVGNHKEYADAYN